MLITNTQFTNYTNRDRYAHLSIGAICPKPRGYLKNSDVPLTTAKPMTLFCLKLH